MNIIFYIVARLLHMISAITGLSYNEINIIVYYFCIPFSWLAMLDKFFDFHWFKIGFALLTVVFLVLGPNFGKFCDALFTRSVEFLNLFSNYGMNYITASVVICVILPLMVYALLCLMLYWKYR
ncbi:MAG: hypothetical protein LBS88_03040 [Tannerellaceae bacterium]|jgi:hypothetical protein|nr:hypothetical protein [Tannerellaceae bacterium]